MEGKVERDTEYSEDGSWFDFSAERRYVGDSAEGVSGKVVVYSDVLSSYSQGDVLRITGEIEPLSEISSPDYRAFLKRQGFVGTMSDPDRSKC